MMFFGFNDVTFLAAVSAVPGAIGGFSSLTFGGPFFFGGWSIGIAGENPFGVGIRGAGVDEPIHDASGSIM
jgi:hypothetical protein